MITSNKKKAAMLLDILFGEDIASNDSVLQYLKLLQISDPNIYQKIINKISEDQNITDCKSLTLGDKYNIKDVIELNNEFGSYIQITDNTNRYNIKTKLFSLIEDKSLSKYKKDEKSKKNYSINILCPNVYGPKTAHLNLVLAYAISLAVLNEVKKLNVIFTFEWLGNAIFNETIKYDRINGIKKYLDILLKDIDLSDDVFKKIEFKYPKFDNNKQLTNGNELFLNGPILRFKGAAYRNGTYLFERQLFNNYPIVTATFNSNYKNIVFTDLLLTRYPTPDKMSRHYTSSSLLQLKSARKLSVSKLVTAFTQSRILDALKKLDSNSWPLLEKLLESFDSWELIGLPDELINDANTILKEKLSFAAFKKISIFSKKDPEQLFDSESLFLVLPHIGGGGQTAAIAITNYVPVVMIKDIKSDISNNLPPENLSNNMPDMIKCAVKLKKDEKFLTDFIDRQNNILASRTNYQQKGAELLDILLEAVLLYEKRKDK